MSFTITEEEKTALLADARETIAARLEKRSPEYKRSEGLASATAAGSSALTLPCGVFVTLHGEGHKLRGCIGRMSASEALEKTVRTMAIEAAFGDPRFPPLQKEELSHCDIEISVLSPMEKCSDPRSVIVSLASANKAVFSSSEMVKGMSYCNGFFLTKQASLL